MIDGPTADQWLAARTAVRERRLELTHAAARGYPELRTIGTTDLLAPRAWLPAEPVPFDRIALGWEPAAAYTGLTGREDATAGARPRRADGRRYATYSEAMGALARPTVFEDRPTYRLLAADLAARAPRMAFGRGRYFAGIDVGEAAAHEFLAGGRAVRDAVGDPTDPARRAVSVAISAVTVRRAGNDLTFLLHWRDPGKVAHAGGLYQVTPSGVFQPSGRASGNEANDFSLWRGLIREYNEEFLGASEDYGSDTTPIDYDRLPVYAALTEGVRSGTVRPYVLGMGVDPLTFATDLLALVVVDAPVFDAAFHGLVTGNAEGDLLSSVDDSETVGIPFTAKNVDRFAHHEPIQAAGAAALWLAWQHRSTTLNAAPLR